MKRKKIILKGHLPRKASSGTSLRLIIYLIAVVIFVGYLFYALSRPKTISTQSVSPSELLIDDLEISH